MHTNDNAKNEYLIYGNLWNLNDRSGINCGSPNNWLGGFNWEVATILFI